MASCLSASYLINCDTGGCSGGLAKVWIAKKDDIDTITYGANNEVTAIVMVAGPPAGVFYEFDFQDGTASFTQSAPTTNCVTAIDQVLQMFIPCQNDTLRVRLQELLDCCCGMVVIVEDMQGVTWIFGDKTRRHVRSRNMELETGAALADQNGARVTLGAIAKNLAVQFAPGPAGVPV